MTADGGVEETTCATEAQQASACLLERGEMGDVTQTEAVTQVGAIAEQGGDAAIVRLEENFEDQASEQLGLGIELGLNLSASGEEPE